MSLLLLAATTHKANIIPIALLGIGAFLFAPLIRLRDQARLQRAAGAAGSSEQKVKWLERAVIGNTLLTAVGIIWMIAEVESLR